MAHRIDDCWLWLGVGVAAFLAAKGIQYALTDLVNLTKIDPYQYEPTKKKEEHPEDALTLDELKVLADSPHPNIADSAISLIITRLARLPHATQVMAKDLASSDTETYRRARQAVHFMRNHEGISFDTRSLPFAPPGYTSPTNWSGVASDTGYEDGRSSPLARLRDELTGANARDVIVPSIEDPVAGWENVPRERGLNGVEEDGFDAETRRRRREAMVLHEGYGAVTGNDIFRSR